MLNDIIAKISKQLSVESFDFSLRPTHDIDNPYTNISENILDKIKEIMQNVDKQVLANILLEQVEYNPNFAYKLHSQVIKMTPKDEGLLFKARLFELLDLLEDDSDEDVFHELNDFIITLTLLAEQKILEENYETAFIITMLYFETVEEMKIRNIPINFIQDMKEHTKAFQLFLNSIALKVYTTKNQKISDILVKDILSHTNKYFNENNLEIIFNMMFSAALASVGNNLAYVEQSLRLMKKNSLGISITHYEPYVRTAIMIHKNNTDEVLTYCHNRVKYINGIENIANIYNALGEHEKVAKCVESILADRKLSNHNKLVLNSALVQIYLEHDMEEEFIFVSKNLFFLGIIPTYYTVVTGLKKLNQYEQYKQEIHNYACKHIPFYEYSSMLTTMHEYDLLVDRFEKITSAKEVKDAILFMDDQGVALYDNNTNKTLLQILEGKTDNNVKHQKHVKSLLELIMI